MDGCWMGAMLGGFCKSHGGGAKCKFEGGCETLVRAHGFCSAHGGRPICSIEGYAYIHLRKGDESCAMTVHKIQSPV